MNDLTPLDGEFFEPADGEGAFAEQAPRANPLELVLGLAELIQQKNIAPLIGDESKLSTIAQTVIDEYEIDCRSREDWLERARDGLKLASMIREAKSYPWEGAANVKFPLIAQAAVQFWSRAYPAIVPPGDVVKAKVHGSDRSGRKAARAKRVAAYQSYYLKKKVPAWKPQTSDLLIQIPIVGHMFRKVWWDPAKRRCQVKLCTADSVVVNNATRCLEEAPRISEQLYLTPNEIASRERSGLFVQMDYSSFKGGKRENEENEADDSGENIADDTLAPQEFIEQHRLIDLDEDGYAEPYIVTVHKESKRVVRIVANFRAEDVQLMVGEEAQSLADVLGFMQQMSAVEQQVMLSGGATNPEDLALLQQGQAALQQLSDTAVVSIGRRDYFQDYRFFPSFDGSYYGIGLGYLLSDTSEAINSVSNMLLDSGHMSSLGGGFIGQGPNLKRSSLRFKPQEWKTINVAGGVLRDAIVPLPVTPPSPVLFQMLGLLIEAGRELANVREVLEGNTPGGAQIQPTTLLALIQQGMQVFSSSIQQIFESLNAEFAMIADLLAAYPDEQHYAAFHDEEEDAPQAMGEGGASPQEMGARFTMASDFNGEDLDIEPVADPRAVTNVQQMGQANLVFELAKTGVVSMEAAVKRLLKAAAIEDTDDLLPKPDPAMLALQQRKEQLLEMLMMKRAGAETAKIEAEAAEKQASAQLKERQASTEGIKQIEGLADAEAAEEGEQLARLTAQRDALIAEDERQRRLAMDELKLLDELITNDHTRRTAGMAGERNDAPAFSSASQSGESRPALDQQRVLGQGAGSAGLGGGSRPGTSPLGGPGPY